ncbi:MAG: DUF6079 family protein [Clostridia bacterium]|nr:DUF6079 family protein [Clostridia bacterium]
MKYSELISFNPIEDVIKLTSANDADKAREYVKTYVMSDAMAESLKTLVVDQLQMDEVSNNKGILIVGNYGTGKSHLMSVISAVANDAENLKYLQNKNFAKSMECIAGKFEVLRFEFTGISMSLREFVLETIAEDFKNRGLDYKVPDLNKIRDNKKEILKIMGIFAQKYPDKGYLLVVDELLNFLRSRTQQDLVMDLEFLRVLGEMSSKSKLRAILGMQEQLFDNPKFAFVAQTLGHVHDRFTEMLIAKSDTAYVVTERILKKNSEQKRWIREYLEKFSNLYSDMSNKMDEFVNMFPIHPAYVEVLTKIYVIENRHILKNISVAIRDIFDTDLPENEPGIISFDDYWSVIKKTAQLRTNSEIKQVLTASEKLEDIIQHNFPKQIYKPLAIKIIYALSIHRLTTNGLDIKSGLTAESLKDDLCLFLEMPVQDPDFLIGVIKTTLDDIMRTVSGQFIVHDNNNDQYYMDVDKTVDFDEKIKERDSLVSPDELNHAFYTIIYNCLEWDAKRYVADFEIYERDLNWDSHKIFREGYLFMGLPNERSTAHPERDFYIHFMPPYESKDLPVGNMPDEVYFYFKSQDKFEDQLKLYTSAKYLANISDGKNKEAYLQKEETIQKGLVKFLCENKDTCFEVGYKGQKRKLIEVLGRYNTTLDFKDTIDLAASLCLEEHFSERYPEYPVMKTKITRKNMAENVRQAFDHFAGRKTATSHAMLDSFNLLKGDKICPENSKYAKYFIKQLKNLPPKGVINYSDIFTQKFGELYEDNHFHIEYIFTPIIFLAMVYGGHATITLKNGTIISAANLEKIPVIGATDLYEFKYLAKPVGIPLAELSKLFELLDINPTLLRNDKEKDEGVKQLLAKAREHSNTAVNAEQKIQTNFSLWGEPLVNEQTALAMKDACKKIKSEFENYSTKFNTPAKLSNFSLTLEQIEELGKQIDLIKRIMEYENFKTETIAIVSYMSNIEHIDIGNDFKKKFEAGKSEFRKIRDRIATTKISGTEAARKVSGILEKIKDAYIEKYCNEHKKKRLGIQDGNKKGKIQSGKELSNLKKLREINILHETKLKEIEQSLANLKVCSPLAHSDLKTTHTCPRCHYSLADRTEQNIAGKLDAIEEQINTLTDEWTKTLLTTLSDPIVADQEKLLRKEQKDAIEKFKKSEKFPDEIDANFVDSVKTLIAGLESVVIDSSEIVAKLISLGPLDSESFKKNLIRIVDKYSEGKDIGKLRIIVK